MSEEKIEKSVNEQIEEQVEEVETESSKIEKSSEKKKSKLNVAKDKIERAKRVSTETREQIEKCMENVKVDIEKLDMQKQALFSVALNPTEKLLKGLGIESKESTIVSESKVELLDLDEGKVEIKELSSGRFKGFFFALVAAVAIFVGWAFTSSKALGLSVPPEKIPDFPRLSKMLEWTSEQLGQGASANIGASAVIISMLLVFWIVYSIIVSMRASSNLLAANETEEAVSLYCTTKEECKEKMKLVREHIQKSTNILAKYKVILEEQNAKIRRAIFLEEAEGFDKLHVNTKNDIATTQQLLVEVKKLMDVPISEAGILTFNAVRVLKEVNKTLNEHILKLYA